MIGVRIGCVGSIFLTLDETKEWWLVVCVQVDVVFVHGCRSDAHVTPGTR